MSSLNSIRIAYDVLRTIAFGDISGNYAAVGSGFSFPARIIKITNTTDANLLVSFNGIDDHDIIPAGMTEIIDYGTNRSASGTTAEQPVGTIVYVKEESASVSEGAVYVTVIYLSER